MGWKYNSAFASGTRICEYSLKWLTPIRGWFKNYTTDKTRVLFTYDVYTHVNIYVYIKYRNREQESERERERGWEK